MTALLNEVTMRDASRQDIDQFIDEISTELRSIPQGKVRNVSSSILTLLFVYSPWLQLSDMSEWLDKFDLKIPLSFSKMEKQFQFLPPTTIQPIGSYSYDGLIVKSSNSNPVVVDLLVEMPHVCIHKKDYLNNIYLEKRAIYLCYLAKRLKHHTDRSLKFAYLNDTTTTTQAVLLVKSSGKKGSYPIG